MRFRRLLAITLATGLGVLAGPLAAGAEPAAAVRDPSQVRNELAAARRTANTARVEALYGELAALEPDNPEVQRGHGLALFLAGRHEQAVGVLRRAVRLDPHAPGARLYLGINLYRSNSFREALTEIEQSPELAAGQPVALYWKGATLRALGEFPAAIGALEAARREDPGSRDTLELLARSHRERASGLLRELLATHPDSAAARLLRAEELALDGVAEAALRELEAALETNPGLPGLHLARGQILWSREEFREAAQEFREELGNDPTSSEASIRLAAFLLDVGDAAGARKHLRRVHHLRSRDDRVATLLAHSGWPQNAASGRPREDPGEALPGCADERSMERVEALAPVRTGTLARCLLALDDPQGATVLLAEMLKLAPGDPESLYLLGRAHERMASRRIEELAARDPNAPAVRMLRGESLERGPSQDFARALEEFRAAVALSPSDAAAHHAAGRVLFKMKRFDEALPHLHRVLANNGNHGMANYLLGKILLDRGERETAIRHLRKAADARPTLLDARRDMARALVLEDRPEEGIVIYRELLQSDPSDASLHALLSVAYRTAGQTDAARQHAIKARDLGAARHRQAGP